MTIDRLRNARKSFPDFSGNDHHTNFHAICHSISIQLDGDNDIESILVICYEKKHERLGIWNAWCKGKTCLHELWKTTQ